MPILGGARLVGRVGAWDVGMIEMQTNDVDSIPDENFGVARIRRGVINPYSYVGAMITSRVGGGEHNTAYGLDKVPGTFFYDNDTGKMVLEREEYDLPTFKEYRTPGMFLWKVYYNKVRAYIDQSILD